MRIAVFTFALVVRIVAIEMTGAYDVKFGDGPDYLASARALCEQRAYPEGGNLPFFRAPGLPFFIAGATLCEPMRTRAIKYGLAACDALSVLLIFLIAQFLGTNAWIAALLASLHPFFVGAVTDIRSEPLFMLFLTAAIWFLLRERRALTGVALGLAALTRPTALLCIPLFALFARRRFLVVLGAALLTLAPWTIRNYVRFGELIVVNDAAGFNLWRGTNRELMEIVATHDTEEFRQRSWKFETETVAETARLVDARAKTPGARDREWRRLALENVRSDPAFAAASTLKKIAMYWRPWLHPAEHGAKAIALSLIVNLGLFILAALGLARFHDRGIVLAVIVFFAALWLAHLPYIPTIRLRVPLTDPLLIVFAAVPLGWLTTRRLSDRVRAALPLLPVVAVIVAVALFATRLGDMPAARAAIETLRGSADAWWSIPLFVALYAACAVFLLPVGLLSAAAALMWGWKIGGTIELVTCTVVAFVPFVLARRGLGGWVERRISREDLPALDSTFVLFLLRIVPVVPYVAMNYIAGATRVRVRDFLITTFLGSIPSTFLFAYFVDTMAAGALGAATQAKIIGVCVLVAAVAIILRLVADRVVRRA